MARRMRIKTGKKVLFYLYVGFGIKMIDLDRQGEKFTFNTERERIIFRDMLEKENPKDMDGVIRLYRMFTA